MTKMIGLLVPATLVLTGLLLAEPAFAAVSVTRAEVSGSRLRIEGTANASRDITVDGVAMGRSDGSGQFEIRRDAYTAPPDCTVSLSDGPSTVTEARLSGCTVSNPPAPTDTTAPTAPTGLTADLAGDTATLSWTASADNVGVTGYRISRNDTLLAGTVTVTTFTDSGLAPGTYTYTVTAFDAAGNTSEPSNSISATVQAPEGLTFLTPSQLPDAAVGQAYLAYISASDPPGPSTFKFKLVSGRVPDGTRFLRNTLENRPEARVSGTPSVRGTYSFTVEVQDNTGATARRTFTIRVL